MPSCGLACFNMKLGVSKTNEILLRDYPNDDGAEKSASFDELHKSATVKGYNGKMS